jgi:subtilisin family serine protease
MTRQRRPFPAGLLLLILLLGLSPQPAPASRTQPASRDTGGGRAGALGQPPGIDGPNAGGQVAVMIELQDAPALLAWSGARKTRSPAAAAQTAQAQARAIDSAQRRLLPQISQAGGQVIFRVQRTLNGIAARLPAERLRELGRLADVKAIRPLIAKSIDNATSVPLIGAPQLWSASVAARGEGVKVGIIDTGIDYLHADFGGSARDADYRRNNTTVISDNVGFPSAKIAGGYDFAGDAYDPSRFDTFFPNPDPDPMDCGGHGTHVAGTLGGYGVGAAGTSYAGPWNTSVPTATMRIGPGVAPKAELYALRVFGCTGTTFLISQALEWATDPNDDFDFSDHLDIVNISISAPFGGTDNDPDADAINSAALAGVLVVAAAGNSSDTFYSIGSPSTADWAVSVASSLDSTAITGAFRVQAPAAIARLYAAAEAEFGPNLARTGALTGTLRYPSGAGQSSGCSAFSAANAGAIRGRIALLDRGTCSFKSKILQAQTAGARGVLIVNNAAGDPPSMADDPTIAAPVTIPSMITSQATGALLKSHLNDPGGISVVLTAAYRNALKNVDQALVDSLSAFSARGPRRGDSALKPDITAPGETIFSADAGTGNSGTTYSGTSMAAPQVAGGLALLRQLHPDWSVEELKALIMNTAGVQTRAGGRTGAPYSPSRQGAGRVTLPAAAAARAVAYNADNPGQVSISFGAPQVVGATTLVKNIRLVNKSGAAATYAIGSTAVVTSSGVTVSPLISSISVAPYSSATFAVVLSVNAALLDRTLDPATPGAQGGTARHFLNEHSGYNTLSGPDTLRVPFYAAPRPASDMRAANKLSFALGTSSAALLVRGSAVNTRAYRSRAWALELQERNPASATSAGQQNAADLRYVGVGSDSSAPGGFTKNTMIYFGLATFGPWSTPGPNDVLFEIFVDTDRDDTPDYKIVNKNPAQVGGAGDADDAFVATVLDMQNRVIATHPINALSAATETAPYNSTVLVLPVAAGDLKLTAGNSRFDYYVLAFQRENPGDIDSSSLHSFDAAAPALSLGGIPRIDDLSGAMAQMRVNRASWLRDRAQGLLLLHELNITTYQAETVPVDVAFYRALLPVARR